MVNFVRDEIVQQVKSELEKFKSKPALAKYGVDAYFVSIFEESHPFHIRYQSDRAYWRDLFEQVKTRNVRKGIKKGFIELQF